MFVVCIAEAVLGCWWRNAHLDCSTRQGYVFDDVISDHLTIRVPHATADKTGTYACQVTGYRADEAKICEFILNNGMPYSLSLTHTLLFKPLKLCILVSVNKHILHK